MFREYLIQNTYIINNCCCFIDGDGLDIWAMMIIHETAALSSPFVITRIVDPGRVYPDSNPTIGKKTYPEHTGNTNLILIRPKHLDPDLRCKPELNQNIMNKNKAVQEKAKQIVKYWPLD